MNKNLRLLKPLGLIISSGLTLIFALISFIITAVNSTYDDGYGVSYSYGRKDLLVIILSSVVILLLGVILLNNAIKKRKTEDWISPAFILASSAIVSFFMLGSILKPVFENEVELSSTYIVNIVSTIIGLAALIMGVIVLVNTLLKKSAYSSLILSYVMSACYILSLTIYCINQGIVLVNDETVVGIFFILAGVAQFIEILPLTYGLKDWRLR